MEKNQKIFEFNFSVFLNINFQATFEDKHIFKIETVASGKKREKK